MSSIVTKSMIVSLETLLSMKYWDGKSSGLTTDQKILINEVDEENYLSFPSDGNPSPAGPKAKSRILYCDDEGEIISFRFSEDTRFETFKMKKDKDFIVFYYDTSLKQAFGPFLGSTFKELKIRKPLVLDKEPITTMVVAKKISRVVEPESEDERPSKKGPNGVVKKITNEGEIDSPQKGPTKVLKKDSTGVLKKDSTGVLKKDPMNPTFELLMGLLLKRRELAFDALIAGKDLERNAKIVAACSILLE